MHQSGTGYAYTKHTAALPDHRKGQQMNNGYIVTVSNKGQQFWLRGTTWAFHADRANVFATESEAKAAAVKAEKFMAPAIRKSYKVEAA